MGGGQNNFVQTVVLNRKKILATQVFSSSPSFVTGSLFAPKFAAVFSELELANAGFGFGSSFTHGGGNYER